ncbi:MAG: hypothetical protein ACRBN8_30925 [Nannocystales bacterium]
MRCSTLIFGLLLAVGCGGDGGAKETEGAPPGPPDTSAGTTTDTPGTTTPGTTDGEPGEPCCEADGDSITCSPCSDDALSCAARRVIGETPTADAFTCQTTCVAAGTVGLWCADDSSCCDAEATCGDEGICRLPDVGTTSSGGSDSGSSSSSSGTGTDGGESTSSSSSSTSDTGDATTGGAGDMG